MNDFLADLDKDSTEQKRLLWRQRCLLICFYFLPFCFMPGYSLLTTLCWLQVPSRRLGRSHTCVSSLPAPLPCGLSLNSEQSRLWHAAGLCWPPTSNTAVHTCWSQTSNHPFLPPSPPGSIAKACSLRMLCICDPFWIWIHAHHSSGTEWILPNLILLEGPYWPWIMRKTTVLLLSLSFIRRDILTPSWRRRDASSVDGTWDLSGSRLLFHCFSPWVWKPILWLKIKGHLPSLTLRACCCLSGSGYLYIMPQTRACTLRAEKGFGSSFILPNTYRQEVSGSTFTSRFFFLFYSRHYTTYW